MSTRDDYPLAAEPEHWMQAWDARDAEINAALDEIDRLRATITHIRMAACRWDATYGGEYHADALLQPECCKDCPPTDEVARRLRTTTVPPLPSQQPPQPRKPEKGTNSADNVDNGASRPCAYCNATTEDVGGVGGVIFRRVIVHDDIDCPGTMLDQALSGHVFGRTKRPT